MDDLGLDLAADPVAVAVMTAFGYLLWLAITREPNPLATTRKPLRRPVLSLGRVAGSIVALSWLVTLVPPARGTTADVIEACLAAAVVLAALAALALVRAVARRRADPIAELNRSVMSRARTGRERPGAPTRAADDDVAVAVDAARVPPGDPDPDPDRWRTRTAEHLERLGANVQSHHLGGPDEARTPADGDAPVTASPAGSRPGERPDRALALPGESPPDAAWTRETRSGLRARVRDLVGEVTSLRRLVIAQQAELDFERQASVRARAGAQRAVEIAQKAIMQKRTAVKLARRERRARLELEGRLGGPPSPAREPAGSSPSRPPASPPRAPGAAKADAGTTSRAVDEVG